MRPQKFPKIPSLISWVLRNLLHIMTIPIVFEAKAMTVKLIIISTAFLLLSIAILFDATTFQPHSNIQEFKNQTSVVIPMPGGAVGPESFAFDRAGGGPFTGVSDGRIIRWRANESRWVDFAVTSPHRYMYMRFSFRYIFVLCIFLDEVHVAYNRISC